MTLTGRLLKVQIMYCMIFLDYWNLIGSKCLNVTCSFIVLDLSGNFIRVNDYVLIT